MAAKSPTFLERLTFSRSDSPVLPLYGKPRKKPSEYDLAELSPRAEDALLSSPSPELPLARPSEFTTSRAFRSPSPTPRSRMEDETGWNNLSPGSDSKQKQPKMLFAGPPPSIAASVVLPRRSKPKASPSGIRRVQGETGESARHMAGSRVTFGSVFFDNPAEARGSPSRRAPTLSPLPNPDSVWRGLQRREKVIEKELQDLLDMQAAGLVAGGSSSNSSEAPSSSAGSERGDAFSDTGSSTPTGTFYSTATSRSRMMMSSIEQPTRSTPSGDIIPVRQPKRSQTHGLRAARSGLRKAIAALADLKVEEDAHVAQALSQRKKALAQLRRLVARRIDITTELEVLEGDEEEPLGKELRELSSEHETLSAEIRELEERLVGMRNRRRWLEGKMDDVKNRRDAGLSGYRGALKEVESEVASLLRRPPVKALDVASLQREPSPLREGARREPSPGGAEFLRLIPERRTAEMAKHWWEGEIALLEKRRAEVDKEREALDEGEKLWTETVGIVSEYESELRKGMKAAAASATAAAAAADSATPLTRNGKGKEKILQPAPMTQADVLRSQLPKMATVILQLEEQLRIAEEKQWNLLICAVGAELEAFKEGEHVLRQTLDMMDDTPHEEEDEQEPLYAANTMVSPIGNGSGHGNGNGITIGGGSGLFKSSPRTSGGNSPFRASPKRLSISNAPNLVDLDPEMASGMKSPHEAITEQDRKDESDNDVPADLLVSHTEDDHFNQHQPYRDEEEEDVPSTAKGHARRHSGIPRVTSPRPLSTLQRMESTNSENEVPPEFLREHTQDSID